MEIKITNYFSDEDPLIITQTNADTLLEMTVAGVEFAVAIDELLVAITAFKQLGETC